MTHIGVVVVTYNSEHQIGDCLDSLPSAVDIVVVDNASRDGTREVVGKRTGVRLIANPWNRGFAAAANQGIGALDCECVLLLNPDARLLGGAGALAAECSDPKTAAAGGKLLDSALAPQRGFMVRRFPTGAALACEVLGLNRLRPGNPVNRRYRCFDLDPDRPSDVEQPAGAFLMIRRDAWSALGGFDESFRPVWFEDVDFLKRAADAGYRIRYVPCASAQHQGAHSLAGVPFATRELCWYGNLLGYASKHFPHKTRVAVCVSVILGSFIRAVWWVLRTRSLKPVSIYAKVVYQAVTHLTAGAAGLLSVSPVLADRPGAIR